MGGPPPPAAVRRRLLCCASVFRPDMLVHSGCWTSTGSELQCSVDLTGIMKLEVGLCTRLDFAMAHGELVRLWPCRWQPVICRGLLNHAHHSRRNQEMSPTYVCVAARSFCLWVEHTSNAAAVPSQRRTAGGPQTQALRCAAFAVFITARH